MKEKAFAAKVNRDHIRLCEEFGFPLPEFAALSVEAMRGNKRRPGALTSPVTSFDPRPPLVWGGLFFAAALVHSAPASG